ncbi:hypothetical protein LWI28_023611 [Acer negundo]|uniref:Uncharacterized protein n=1 Tax=Acer negundo TaxID=4023 RepID=A0AAD5IRH6_ACENE|nr:hypothetical protein LWI28_023611 [Acer negundo]
MDTRSKSNVEFLTEVNDVLARHETSFDETKHDLHEMKQNLNEMKQNFSQGPTPPVADQTNEGITSTSELPTPQDGRPQETEDLANAMIELAGGKELLLRGVQVEAADGTDEADQGLEAVREQGDA